MDITESPLVQPPSPKVSTHVHGLGYCLIHPLCITAVMYKLLLLLLQLGAAAKELSPPKLQSTPTTSAKVAMDITESHLLSSNNSTSSSSDEGVIQHPSPKVSTHVHGLGYRLYIHYI